MQGKSRISAQHCDTVHVLQPVLCVVQAITVGLMAGSAGLYTVTQAHEGQPK